VVRALDDKRRGGEARYGPKAFPHVDWPDPLDVPPPWEGGDGQARNRPERKRAARLGVQS
jgi:hypothetical protein